MDVEKWICFTDDNKIQFFAINLLFLQKLSKLKNKIENNISNALFRF